MGKLIAKAGRPVLTIFITLLLGALMIASAGENPLSVYGVLFAGAFGSQYALLNTLAKATPLIFTGLAAAIADLAGVFNIGIEGQLYFGALAAAVTGVYLGDLPVFILIPLCLIAAMLASVIWALIPGYLNYKLKINIFIMFFMMNNMAALITEFLANGPFKGELPEATTAKVSQNARLFRFSPFSDLNLGFIIAIIMVIVLWFVLKKTRTGYEWSAIGKNRTFSEYIGIHAGKKAMFVLMISAMLSGLAGAEQSIGQLGRFYANFSNDLGFTGISIGLLASNNPIGVLIFAVFFGALNNGSISMAANTGVPSDLIKVLQSLMILMVSADFVLRTVKRGRAKKKEAA